MTAPAPEVSVVVICFNDAGRLPRAVASVQRQTLRNLEIVIVDDASTDETAAVAEAIVAADPRVRYERLERNSGGCSAPRNRGLDLARAEWVMFCDSDDEYERHACKNLLLAAERTGAEIVCGTAVRVDTRTGRRRRWRPELHDADRVADSLDALPDLLYDTISVNKIYRSDLLRRNAIRFPEGILFEDQLFTLQAMAAARRLAVIPQTTYHWYVDRLADDLSITQRRGETRNVDSRIEVNRRIDRFLDERGLSTLRAAKDEKFLRHDLYLYLLSMVDADDATASGLIDRLAPYVEEVPLATAWRLRPALRVAVYFLLRRDLAGVRSAMRFLAWASSVDATICADDGRDRWRVDADDRDGASGDRAADGAAVGGIPARDWLDVTDLGLPRVPFSQRRLLHRIGDITVTADGRLRVQGRTRDYDGSLLASDAPELRFLAGGQVVAELSLAWTGAGPSGSPGWFGWTGAGVLAAGLTAPLVADEVGLVAVALSRDTPGSDEPATTIVNVTPVRSERSACPDARIPLPGPVRRTGPDTLVLGPQENGAVGWRAVVASVRRRRLVGLVARWRRLPGSARLATVAELVQRDWLRPSATRLGRLLPRRDVLLLESRDGRWCGGDVAAVSAAFGRRRPATRQVWAVRDGAVEVPAGADRVVRGGVRHAWLLARSRWVVGDGADQAGAASDALTVNVGPGVPIGRLGLDDPSTLTQRSAVATLRRAGRRTHILFAPSAAAASVTGPALGVRGSTRTVGQPSLDEALRRRRLERASMRPALDLPADRAIVVWAPVRRRTGQAADLLDLDAWAADFGAQAYLVACSPPGAPIEVPTRLRWAVRAVPAALDQVQFLAAADLVIADYGRAVGEAAALDIPLVLFWPDRAACVDRAHGVYPHVHELDPILDSSDDLRACLRAWLADPASWAARFAPVQRAWADHWCGPTDANSADRAVQVLLEGDR